LFATSSACRADRSTKEENTMDIRFDQRVVLVSGAAQGIGRSIATAFLDAGARVHLADINEDVRRTAADIGAVAHVLDLSDRAASTALIQDIATQEGRIDILALAAGGVCGQADLPLADITEENWNQVFSANVKGALWLSQAAAPFMQKAGWGRIVIISSGAGLRPSLTGLHAYTSAKHAVIGLTKQLSVGLAQYGITANSVAPGLIRSNPATERQWEGYGAEGQRRLVEGLHTRRMGKAEDIAAATLFFASEQANWITGQVLSVDGGRS
jgi:3-oxoacyl-[acyl-carrier protein] reductase